MSKIKNILRKYRLVLYKIGGKAPNTKIQVKFETERHGSDMGDGT